MSGIDDANTEGAFCIFDSREELVNEYEITGVEPVAVIYCRGTGQYLFSGYQDGEPGNWQIDPQSVEIQRLLKVAYSDMSCSPDGSPLAGLPEEHATIDIVEIGGLK